MALQLEMRRQREVSGRVWMLACVCACEGKSCTGCGWGGAFTGRRDAALQVDCYCRPGLWAQVPGI